MPAEEMHHGAQDSAREAQPTAQEQQTSVETGAESREQHQAALEALAAESDAKDVKIAEHETLIAQQDARISKLEADLKAALGGTSLELPTGVKGHIRETIKFENLGERSSKYNSQGVDPENPYNAFAKEAEPKGAERTEDQPRRSRKLTNGETEVLVKYNNNGKVEYKWEKAPDKSDENEVAKGWDEFRRERDAGVFNAVKPWEATNSAVTGAGGDASEVAPAEATPASTQAAEQAQTSELPPLPERSPEEAAAERERAAEAAESSEPAEGAQEDAESEPVGAELAIDKEIMEKLAEAQETYAKLSAKHRNSYLGHYLTNSKFLAKVPVLKSWADKRNEKADAKELGPAREAYRDALKALQENIKQLTIAEHGNTEKAKEEYLFAVQDHLSDQELNFETKLAEERIKLSGESNDLVNWWVRQDTVLRRAGKFAVIAGVTVPIGIVAGLGGLPALAVAGVAAGAGIGAFMGNMATKGRASAETRQGGILAENQRDADFKAKGEYADGQIKSGQDIDVDTLIGMTEKRTGAEKTGNRMRIKGAAGAGAAGAGVGLGVGGQIRAGIDNYVAGLENTNPQGLGDKPDGIGNNGLPDGEAPSTEAPQAPAPELQGQDFFVESGNGPTQELVDFAQANGHNLDANQSLELHKAITDQFGADYIQGQDMYNMGGDAYNNGIAASGNASWEPGVAEFIKNWMTSKGLW